jgi:hypothetical protein
MKTIKAFMILCQQRHGMVNIHLQVGIYDNYQRIHDALPAKKWYQVGMYDNYKRIHDALPVKYGYGQLPLQVSKYDNYQHIHDEFYHTNNVNQKSILSSSSTSI